jgi:hypothetical protein
MSGVLDHCYPLEARKVPLHLMQGRGRRPIGGLSSPVPGRMEDTLKPPIELSNINCLSP